jgi:exodeoxyribonuclease VII large subunit
MWRSSLGNLKELPKLGDIVEARCQLRVWGKYGKVQIIVSALTAHEDEKGERQKQLEEWEKTCAEKGWFSADVKKSVEPVHTKISIVTSKTGAALQDCISVIQRRCPMAELWIHDAVVQGPSCPNSVRAGIEAASNDPSDVVIVCRGGGSKDDLFYWNHPDICKAIYECPKPVVSGVGHQIDVNLVDFASDLVCPTPSVAAEKTVLDYRNLLQDSRKKLHDVNADQRKEDMVFRINNCRRTISRFLKAVKGDVEENYRYKELERSNRMKGLDARLRILDPQNTLNRGYALVRSKKQRLCTSIKDVRRLRNIVVQFKDGFAELQVNNMTRKL